MSAFKIIFRKRFLKYSYNKTQAFNLSTTKNTIFVAFKFMATKTKYWTGVCVHVGNDVPKIIFWPKLIEANNYFNYMVDLN